MDKTRRNLDAYRKTMGTPGETAEGTTARKPDKDAAVLDAFLAGLESAVEPDRISVGGAAEPPAKSSGALARPFVPPKLDKKAAHPPPKTSPSSPEPAGSAFLSSLAGKKPSAAGLPAASSRALPAKPASPAKAEPKPPAKTAKSATAPSGPEGFVLSTRDGQKASPYRKIAKFLLLIGKEEAAKVMSHLEAAEVEAISREIAGITHIGNEEATHILSEFGFIRETRQAEVRGGVETARRMLENVYGEFATTELLRRVLPHENRKFFDFLDDFSVHQLETLFKGESVGVMGMVLPHLDPALASKILSLQKEPQRTELVARMARMQKIDRNILLKIEEAIRERAHHLADAPQEETFEGASRLAEILRHMSPSEGEQLLDALADEDPDIAREVRERVFTIEQINLLDRRDLQKVLTELDDRQMALLLKGKSEEVRRILLEGVSERRRLLITDEYRLLGPVPRRDADQACADFLALLRRKEQEGSLRFDRGDLVE